MSIIDRLFALRGCPPFDQLRAAELVLIASAVRERSFGAGELVGAAGRPLRHLFVRAEGSIRTASGVELPPVFGAPSLLFGTPLEEALHAGPGGASCLLIRRAHFHTIMSECPVLMMGLMRDAPLPEPVSVI